MLQDQVQPYITRKTIKWSLRKGIIFFSHVKQVYNLVVLGQNGNTTETVDRWLSLQQLTTLLWSNMIARAPAITSVFQESEIEERENNGMLPPQRHTGSSILHFCSYLISQVLRQIATSIKESGKLLAIQFILNSLK